MTMRMGLGSLALNTCAHRPKACFVCELVYWYSTSTASKPAWKYLTNLGDLDEISDAYVSDHQLYMLREYIVDVRHK
jgi:hypothetical protein